MTRHDADWLRRLVHRHDAAQDAFAAHLDECLTCFEGAWDRQLCEDGRRLMHDARDLALELEEADAL